MVSEVFDEIYTLIGDEEAFRKYIQGNEVSAYHCAEAEEQVLVAAFVHRT